MTLAESDKDAQIDSLTRQLAVANARIERLKTLVRIRDEVIREIRRQINRISTARI